MREATVVVHRRVNRQADFPAQTVVFQPVAGRDVNESRAGVAGDKIVAGKKLPLSFDKRMFVA